MIVMKAGILYWCLFAGVSSIAHLSAQNANETKWTGISGTDWDGAGSWTNGVPTESSDVLMTENVNGYYVFVEGSASRTISSLKMGMWNALIKLNSSVPEFRVTNTLTVDLSSPTWMACISSQNSTGDPGDI